MVGTRNRPSEEEQALNDSPADQKQMPETDRAQETPEGEITTKRAHASEEDGETEIENKAKRPKLADAENDKTEGTEEEEKLADATKSPVDEKVSSDGQVAGELEKSDETMKSENSNMPANAENSTEVPAKGVAVEQPPPEVTATEAWTGWPKLYHDLRHGFVACF